jgi:hypothetical protein
MSMLLRASSATAAPRKSFLNVRLLVFMAATLALLIGATAKPVDLAVIGCDAFGYSQQGQLFRENGLVRGLDTRIKAEEAKFIVAIAKKITLDSRLWSTAVAPACHHYNPAVDAVILQYPPGTGLILSLFPENPSLNFALIVGRSLASAAFVIAVAMTAPEAGAAALAFSLLIFVQLTIHYRGATGSPSIPITLSIIPLSVLLTLLAFRPSNKRASPGLAILLGLTSGLLVATRLANVLALTGLVCAIVVNRALWRPAMARRTSWAIAVALVGFAATGGALLASADWINAGSPFATTYGAGDAALPVFSIELFGSNLLYYLTDAETAFATPVALAALFATVLILWRASKRNLHDRGATIGAFFCYFVSLAYFCTHTIRIPYYMLPASIMTLCLLLFDFLQASPPERLPEPTIFRLSWLVAPFLIFIGIRFAFVEPANHNTVTPDEVRAPESIVWASGASGTLYYHQNKYAAALGASDACIQERLVREVAARGRPQYFIEDSPGVSAMIRRLSKSFAMERAGVFENYFFGQLPIWKIAANTPWEGSHCSGTDDR